MFSALPAPWLQSFADWTAPQAAEAPRPSGAQLAALAPQDAQAVAAWRQEAGEAPPADGPAIQVSCFIWVCFDGGLSGAAPASHAHSAVGLLSATARMSVSA